MAKAPRFSVLTTGVIEEGFDEHQAAMDIVDLLNTSPERALAFIHTKQSLITNVDKKRALAYQKKLASIGLRVEVVDCDDVTASDETITSEPKRFSDSSTKAESAASQSEHTDQPKYTDTHTDASHEENIIDSIRNTGNAIDIEEPSAPVFSIRNRTLRLGVLACISAALVGFIYVTRTNDAVASAFVDVPTYHYNNIASADMNTLVKVSGMQHDIHRFSGSLLGRFRTQFFNLETNNTGLSERRYQELMTLVPQAYNTQALHNTVASRLQKHTFEDDVPTLIEAFENPAVQAFIERRQQRTRRLDKAGFLAYQEFLANNPLDGARNRAITRLFDALILDKVQYEIDGDVQRALITTQGAIEPNKDATTTKEATRKALKTMRDELVYARPDIRRTALHELSWQLQETSVEDIASVRTALDDSSVRELYRQMVTGYEDYLKNATLWLHREL